MSSSNEKADEPTIKALIAWTAETIAQCPLLRLAVFRVTHYSADPAVVPLLHIVGDRPRISIVQDDGLRAFCDLAREAVTLNRSLIVQFPGSDARAIAILSIRCVGLYLVVIGLYRPAGHRKDERHAFEVMTAAAARLQEIGI